MCQLCGAEKPATSHVLIGDAYQWSSDDPALAPQQLLWDENTLLIVVRWIRINQDLRCDVSQKTPKRVRRALCTQGFARRMLDAHTPVVAPTTAATYKNEDKSIRGMVLALLEDVWCVIRRLP